MENNIPEQAPNNAPQQTEKPNPALPQDPVKTPPVDPEYQKWAEETKDLATAYKRYSDSSKEALRQKEEREEIARQAKKHEDYIAALTQEVQLIAQRDPDLLKRWQETVAKKETAPNNAPQLSPEQIDARAMQAAEFKVELNRFYDEYGSVIKDETERASILQVAKNLSDDSVMDPKTRKPYTLRGALLAATRLQHPELLNSDRTSMERRDSAAEPGGLPLGTSHSSSETELSEAEMRIANKMGISPETYAKYR